MQGGDQTTEVERPSSRMSMISTASTVIQERVDKKACNEVKSFTHPPEGVKDVLTATFILMGRPLSELTWSRVKKEISSPTLVNEIKDFDIEKIPDKARKEAMKYLSKYNADQIKKISITAAIFYDWAIAVARD